ncbi:MAG: extracellular solute-binding protein [Actinophytocola sp.]|nr:extracellular solute-binding protein [Actinophytocola sp.]
MNRFFFRRLPSIGLAVALLFPLLAACGNSDALVIYSGRQQALVGDLLGKLEKELGMDVEVRYGGSAEMAAQLLEEKEPEADLFYSQDSGALGALTEAGKLATLPRDDLDIVDKRFQADDGSWVATSARARVVAYDPKQVSEQDLPSDLDDLLDEKWRGKVGYAPSNGSWQAFVTAVRQLKGEDGARDWLVKFKQNNPQAYENNVLIRDAVDKGEVALGLINHYYYHRKIAEEGAENVNVKLHYVGGNDPLALINVAGVGVIKGSDKAEAAQRAVRYLLSESAQQYFADETAEYPVREGVTSTKHDLPKLSGIESPDIDLSSLSSLKETLALLQEVGLS